ncbi:glycosyltransferase family 2 protein [Pontibacter ruber]|uniref:Glycosyltransferase family 2 protein n=1 Tax=Pontibacter ruber TaxID=1343895 RepID=A0ABW5CUD4_9BACT|nr:glycosyltransferase family A protein [Pontibacter ruber]
MIPKVSILIPLFNSENFITEAIKSVFNQTWKNIEIIIVDDGSTDNSFSIAKSFESEKVKVFSIQNGGACKARNFAFAKSTGDYIQYLDADDILSKNKIENQLLLLMTNGPETIASCAWGRFHKNITDWKVELQRINKSYDFPLNWLIDSWSGRGVGQTSIWLTPRKLIETAGPWNEKLTVNQDGEFFSRVITRSKSIIYCSNSFVYYRSSSNNSISRAPFSKDKAQSLLKSYKLYMDNIPVTHFNLEVKKALARNFAEFIYRFEDKYPELSKEAWIELYKLGVVYFEPVGGGTLSRLTRMVGFNKALKLRKLFNFIKNKFQNY